MVPTKEQPNPEKAEPVSRWDRHGPLIVSISACTVCMYFNCVVQVLVQRRAARWARSRGGAGDGFSTPLPDLGFEILPHLKVGWLADAMVGLALAATLLRFLLTPRRAIIYRRLFTLLGWLFLLRGVSIAATMLPNPFAGCTDNVVGTGRGALLEGLGIMVGARRTCADVFFSGHTVNLTLCALTFHHYSHIAPVVACPGVDALLCGCCAAGPRGPQSAQDVTRCSLSKALVWAYAVAGYLVIIASRFHYSIDTIFALLLTVLSWKGYHHYIRTTASRPNVFNRCLAWFERGADDALREELPPLTSRMCKRWHARRASRKNGVAREVLLENSVGEDNVGEDNNV